MVVNFDETYKLIKETFCGITGRVIVPGFIATASGSDEITILGRGGSDYTAALIASALSAKGVEIWGGSDGFMTADPAVISKAYPIAKLSYTEAMELCNFGAKVIFPPTIYPAYAANIPIHIHNIEKPEKAGTIISAEKDLEEKTIKGISSINNTSLITMQGMGMLGVGNVNGRAFSSLYSKEIDTFFISQASSGSSISIGIKDADADIAISILNKEFKNEISQGAINSISVDKNLATIAI